MEFCYVDGNTPYVQGKDVNEVIQLLGDNSLKPFQQFKSNQMKANVDKYSFLKVSKEVSSSK